MMQAFEIQSRHLLVYNFYGSASSYVAFCQDNIRLDITKCRSFVPSELDPSGYYHYMWIHSLQGYHILRQRLRGKISEDWFVVAEVVPEEFSHYLFEELWDDFPQVVDRLNQTFPLGGLAILDLAPLQRLGADMGL